MKTKIKAALVLGAVLMSAQLASANLISNGSFDTDLAGWDTTGTTTGVTWISGTAHVGRPGTPGVSIFSQEFDIDVDAHKLLINFDYEWQVLAPPLIDTFLVELIYESTLGTITNTLLSEGSDNGLFNSTVPFSSVLSITNLDNASSPNGLLRFTLAEVNIPAGTGTRIQLDNVSVVAVPIASTAWLMLVGLIGLFRPRQRALPL